MAHEDEDIRPPLDPLMLVNDNNGAIDGSHIRIDKPVLDADSYINRKQYFSIHLQGIVNQHLKFIDVFIGYPDSFVEIITSCWGIDNGHLTRAQRRFNQKLSSCRVVENAFGCLKQRFRQFYHFKLRNIPRM
ncbi:hypothetical protein X777_04741, partial [Ooceraea biroi]